MTVLGAGGCLLRSVGDVLGAGKWDHTVQALQNKREHASEGLKWATDPFEATLDNPLDKCPCS